MCPHGYHHSAIVATIYMIQIIFKLKHDDLSSVFSPSFEKELCKYLNGMEHKFTRKTSLRSKVNGSRCFFFYLINTTIDTE